MFSLTQLFAVTVFLFLPWMNEWMNFFIDNQYLSSLTSVKQQEVFWGLVCFNDRKYYKSIMWSAFFFFF